MYSSGETFAVPRNVCGRRFLVPGQTMARCWNARLTAIKFAGDSACQVVAGALSVAVEPALDTCHD
ncbi:hypothetical protein PS720_03752 [Pseudomonas fluorescens]|nr:hypothetical protein PS720_03752 [Pseudomonas fluorescens]